MSGLWGLGFFCRAGLPIFCRREFRFFAGRNFEWKEHGRPEPTDARTGGKHAHPGTPLHSRKHATRPETRAHASHPRNKTYPRRLHESPTKNIPPPHQPLPHSAQTCTTAPAKGQNAAARLYDHLHLPQPDLSQTPTGHAPGTVVTPPCGKAPWPK